MISVKVFKNDYIVIFIIYQNVQNVIIAEIAFILIQFQKVTDYFVLQDVLHLAQ